MMMDFSSLQQLIYQVNNSCNFANPLDAEKVAEAAGSVPADTVHELLKHLSEQKGTISNPTAWITNGLRKASGGGGGAGGGGAKRSHSMGPGSGQQADQKLRERIGWLNDKIFGGCLIYDKVVSASGGLPYSEVMRTLKTLEENKGAVKDPNAWVCSALRKAGGAQMPAAAAAAFPVWGGAPSQAAWGAPPMGMGMGSPGPMHGGDNSKVRKRVEWLNTAGGFGNAINISKVLEVTSGADVQQVMKVLKILEEEKNTIKDPTAYVTAALRKLGGGQHSAGGSSHGAFAPMAWSGPAASPAAAPAAAWTPGAQAEDGKLRKRIGWLNTQGGFEGTINYAKIMSAAGGVEFSDIFEKLKFLEGKKGEVSDPTAWICSGLRKAATQLKTGTAHAPMGSGPTPASALSPDDDAKLRKRIGWLNTQGGFAGAINYAKILSAKGEVPFSEIWEKLKFLEGKKGEVSDPNAWICAGLRKAASPDMDSEDAKLRKRIGWLNTQGGFEGSINYAKILSARGSVPFSEIFEKLKFLEGKKGEVTDPTAWVCSGLRKAGAKVPAVQKGGPSAKGSGKGGGLAVKKTIGKGKH